MVRHCDQCRRFETERVENLKFNIDFWYKEKYLPTKRHRKLRERYVKNSVDVEIKELTESEFPIAFIVHDQGWQYDEECKEAEWKMIDTEIRIYNGELWKAVRYSEWVSRGVGWMPISYIKNRLQDYAPYWKGGEEFTEASIIKDNNISKCKENIFRKAEGYIIYDGKVWKTCEEPMYVINTFGLGHNHGGTGFFIEYFYNENISRNNYFNALEREQAIAYGKKVAANRGDTDSIDGMGEHDIIEVLMPEMVKRNPGKEHGDGDPFINSMEDIISGSGSAMEAGLLCIAKTVAEISL